ncbi:hypothetical protein C8J57DRAFT_1361735 [Mycena rebaudengoi]|nr:hypothetical protein C8J57DRAFT_1361735 [Mycena rebaudengoi]
MIPLIQLINPDSFLYGSNFPQPIISLLENIGSPSEDLVQLWKDYQFLDSLENTIHAALKFQPTDNNNSSLPTDGFQLLSQGALLPRILQAYILGAGQKNYRNFMLLDIHFLLDISWADLRAAMCPLRHIVGGTDSEGVRRLLWFVAEHLSPDIAITQLSSELAQGCVRLLRRPVQRHWHLRVAWGRFIRASPPFLELLEDIRQVSFEPYEWNGLENSPENYHDTIQWLKAFPDPPQDVIEVWEQHLIVASKAYEHKWKKDPQYDLEARWRKRRANYEMWFPHLIRTE